LANIEAKYNNPKNMKNYLEELPNSELTSDERIQLKLNINGRYAAENFPPEPAVFNHRKGSRTLAPRASNAALQKTIKAGAPPPPYRLVPKLSTP